MNHHFIIFVQLRASYAHLKNALILKMYAFQIHYDILYINICVKCINIIILCISDKQQLYTTIMNAQDMPQTIILDGNMIYCSKPIAKGSNTVFFAVDG